MRRWTSIALVLVTTPFAAARAQTGSLEGTVANAQTGAPVAQAVVTLTGTNRTVLTNDNGYFVIPNIPVGIYDVHAAAHGFQSAVRPNAAVKAATPTLLQFRLEPEFERFTPDPDPRERLVGPTPDVPVLQPGFGVGGAVGIEGFRGGSSGSLENGVGLSAFVHLVTRQGWSLHAGAHFSDHGIAQASPPYHHSAAYIEPRFVLLNISSGWAPFIMGRVSRNWEIVEGPTVKITASGHSFGGGGGVAVRVAPQVTAETGISLERMTFGAYTFRGDFAWKTCLDALQGGAPLPESIVRCSGSRSVGGVADFCYPPYFSALTNNCTPPDIPYPNSQRTAMSFRLWVGMKLSFAKAEP